MTRVVLTPAMLRVLEDMRAAEETGELEDAELVCDGRECWRGDHKTSRATVTRLLQLTLVSSSNWSGGSEVMTLNDAGRAVLRRPDLAGELAAALQQGAPFTIGPDDKLHPMDPKPAHVPAMLAGSHRKGSGSVVPAPDIRDLTAVAMVRRILLELGRELSPEALQSEASRVGGLELWVHAPHPELEGRKPLDVLQTPEGEQQVRVLLARLVERNDGGGGPGAPPGEQAGS